MDWFTRIDQKLHRNPSQYGKKWVLRYMQQLIRKDITRHLREFHGPHVGAIK